MMKSLFRTFPFFTLLAVGHVHGTEDSHDSTPGITQMRASHFEDFARKIENAVGNLDEATNQTCKIIDNFFTLYMNYMSFEAFSYGLLESETKELHRQIEQKYNDVEALLSQSLEMPIFIDDIDRDFREQILPFAHEALSVLVDLSAYGEEALKVIEEMRHSSWHDRFFFQKKHHDLLDDLERMRLTICVSENQAFWYYKVLPISLFGAVIVTTLTLLVKNIMADLAAVGPAAAPAAAQPPANFGGVLGLPLRRTRVL